METLELILLKKGALWQGKNGRIAAQKGVIRELKHQLKEEPRKLERKAIIRSLQYEVRKLSSMERGL